MGALVINHNTQAINTHRRLLDVDHRLKTSLEHLSSGEKIVRAADAPAQLMISEQMRAQVASIVQAIDNAHTGVSMVQTTEAVLDEVNRLLVGIRQRAIHAANEGANDPNMLAADQFEVKNSLESIDRIAQFAEFGKKKLLDGSNGVNGLAAGAGLVFVKATPDTRPSPAMGYDINIRQAATRATFTSQPITKELIDKGLTLSFEEHGRVASITTKKGEDINVVQRRLQNELDLNGLELEVTKTADDGLMLTHRKYGADESFTVVSDMPNVVSDAANQPVVVHNGFDVAGSINGQLATGKGRILTAAKGTAADGLQVLYTGQTPDDYSKPVGSVKVNQGSLVFQIGPDAGQKVKVALNSVNTRTVALNVPNASHYKNLSEVDVRTPQGAEDTMRLVDKAIDDITVVRGELGAVQKNAMEANIRSLNVSREELTSAESVIRDADMAAEVSEFTRNQVILQSGLAMLGHANSVTRNVLTLIQNS
jgi:flagellin